MVEEALDIVRRESVHLLLLDMHMPRLTGLETLRRVKQFNAIVAVHFDVGQCGSKSRRAGDAGAGLRGTVEAGDATHDYDHGRAGDGAGLFLDVAPSRYECRHPLAIQSRSHTIISWRTITFRQLVAGASSDGSKGCSLNCGPWLVMVPGTICGLGELASMICRQFVGIDHFRRSNGRPAPIKGGSSRV